MNECDEAIQSTVAAQEYRRDDVCVWVAKTSLLSFLTPQICSAHLCSGYACISQYIHIIAQLFMQICK